MILTFIKEPTYACVFFVDDSKYNVIQASRIKADKNNFQVRCNGVWFKVLIFGKGSKENCERSAAHLGKALVTDLSDSSSDISTHSVDNDADDDIGDEDENNVRVVVRGNQDLDVSVSSLITSASNLSLADAYVSNSNLISKKEPKELISTNKEEFKQIMTAISGLTDIVGILSKKLENSDQNNDPSPIVELF